MAETMRGEAQLPDQFRELEDYLDWALPTIGARRAKRLGSSMEEIDRFYEVILPRMTDISTYLKQFDLAALNDPQRRLLDLAFSLMAVAPAVEIFRQPEVKGNTFPYSRFTECDPISGAPVARV